MSTEEKRKLNGCDEEMSGAETGEANLGTRSPQSHIGKSTKRKPKVTITGLETSEFAIEHIVEE